MKEREWNCAKNYPNWLSITSTRASLIQFQFLYIQFLLFSLLFVPSAAALRTHTRHTIKHHAFEPDELWDFQSGKKKKLIFWCFLSFKRFVHRASCESETRAKIIKKNHREIFFNIIFPIFLTCYTKNIFFFSARRFPLYLWEMWDIKTFFNTFLLISSLSSSHMVRYIHMCSVEIFDLEILKASAAFDSGFKLYFWEHLK